MALTIPPLGYNIAPRPGAAHSHFLVEAQALVDGSSVRDALHDFLWELFEEVGWEVAAVVGDGVAGHDSWVVRHHPGRYVDFLTNDCTGGRKTRSRKTRPWN